MKASAVWNPFLISCLLMLCSRAAWPNGGNKEVISNLKQKIQTIDNSIKITRSKIGSQANAKFTPDLLFMLAELYLDKATVSKSLKQELAKDKSEVDETAEKQILSEASEQYRIIEERYPEYSKLDRVLFNRGNLLKLMGNENEALAKFKAVTVKFPNSKYADQALLEIANIFLDKKDYDYSIEFFTKATTSKELKISLTAKLKIGLIYTLQEKWTDSMKSFESIYDVPHENTVEVLNLKEEALIASVYPLLEILSNQTSIPSNWKNPISYYLSKNIPDIIKARALQRLATRYEIKKQEHESAKAYWEVFRLLQSPTEKKAAFETAYLKHKKLKLSEFPQFAIDETISLILKMHSSFEPTSLTHEVSKYEVVLRDLLTSQQKLIMATKRLDELKTLAQQYRDYLVLYPNYPDTPLMKLNLAELYFHSGQYHLAGRFYNESVQYQSHPKISKKDALNAALESFLAGASDLKSPSYELILNQAGYKLTALNYLKLFPGDPKSADILFNIGKITYDEQNFEEAAKLIFSWLQKYPRHNQARNATLLYLDCYYLRNQLKELIAASQRVQGIVGLDSSIKAQAKAASEQTQMRAVRSIAGEFGSKKYAIKFAEFARKNKNSQLGEQALYEAFASLRSQNSPEVYEIGEEYVSTYPNTQRGKEVFLSLTQIALTRFDYLKAAGYLASYGQKYENESNSKPFLEQAGLIFELFGKTEEAISSYRLAGQGEKAVALLVKQNQWAKASSESSKIGGIAGSFYQGLALYRQGDVQSATRLLNQVATASSSLSQEKMMIGHAANILAEIQIAKFAAPLTSKTFSPQVLQLKTNEYQAISQLTDLAIQSQGGKWVIGGIYNLAKLNRLMANFLNSAEAPNGMDSQQLKSLLNPQIQSYLSASKELVTQCVELANKNEILSGFTGACLSNQNFSERLDSPTINTNFKTKYDPLILKPLIDNPKDVKQITQTATQLILNGNIPTAHLILLSSLETHSQNSDIYSLLGITSLHLKDYEISQTYFKKALEINPQNSMAIRGLAGLAKNFSLAGVFAQYQKRAPSNINPNLHPWLNF